MDWFWIGLVHFCTRISSNGGSFISQLLKNTRKLNRRSILYIPPVKQIKELWTHFFALGFGFRDYLSSFLSCFKEQKRPLKVSCSLIKSLLVQGSCAAYCGKGFSSWELILFHLLGLSLLLALMYQRILNVYPLQKCSFRGVSWIPEY